MKSKNELSALREEVEALSKKLRELTEDELAEVTGGRMKAMTLVDVAIPGLTLDGASNANPYEIHIYTTETEEEARRKFSGK